MSTALLVAKSPAEARLVEMLSPAIEGLGYEIVRLRMMGSGGRDAPITLQIMAEKPDGTMEIEDCAQLSQTVSAVLDVEDPIEREFTLEVSSPGIDRPLTRDKDFATYKGYRARVEMSFPVAMAQGDRRRFQGDLGGLEDDALVIVLDDLGPVSLKLRDVADAKLILTDELIAESLKGRKVSDPAQADDIEYETEDDDAGGETPRNGEK